MTQFAVLKAVFLKRSIKKDGANSHTQLLMNCAAVIKEPEVVDVEHVYALNQTIASGSMWQTQRIRNQSTDKWI